MNYLAHIYLSFDHVELMVGNYIADHIKGNKIDDYPSMIQKGIVLHRWIDTFTDQHPLVRRSSRRLHPTQHHYSRVAVDMIYDHFLSTHWREYSKEPLEQFVRRFYQVVSEYKGNLPDETRRITPVMIERDWLLQYRELDRLNQSFYGLYIRTRKRSALNTAVSDLIRFYPEFEQDFLEFFPELIRETLKKVHTLLH